MSGAKRRNFFVAPLPFLKCPLSEGAHHMHCSGWHAFAVLCLKLVILLHIETWFSLNKSWKNVNTVCILTLLVAWGWISSWSVATRVGDYNETWDLTPAETSNSHWTRCNWVNGCKQEIGEGKGQHTYVCAIDSCHWHVESTSLQCYLYRKLSFLALRVQLVVLVSAFAIVSTVWSLFCSFTLGAPVPSQL